MDGPVVGRRLGPPASGCRCRRYPTRRCGRVAEVPPGLIVRRTLPVRCRRVLRLRSGVATRSCRMDVSSPGCSSLHNGRRCLVNRPKNRSPGPGTRVRPAARRTSPATRGRPGRPTLHHLRVRRQPHGNSVAANATRQRTLHKKPTWTRRGAVHSSGWLCGSPIAKESRPLFDEVVTCRVRHIVIEVNTNPLASISPYDCLRLRVDNICRSPNWAGKLGRGASGDWDGDDRRRRSEFDHFTIRAEDRFDLRLTHSPVQAGIMTFVHPATASNGEDNHDGSRSRKYSEHAIIRPHPRSPI